MYKRILVAIDGSETSGHAFDTALQLARDNGAQLQPLYVIDNPLMAYDASGYDPTALRDASMQEGQQLLAGLFEGLHQLGVPRRKGVDARFQLMHIARGAGATMRADGLLELLAQHRRLAA